MNDIRSIFIIFFIVFNFLYTQKNATEESGDIIQIALPLIAFSTTLIWKDSNDGSLQFLKAIGVSILITHGLKRLINRRRPNGGNYGFPSGHTSATFTGAAFIEKRYGWKFGIPAYLLASYVGFTRINANKHDIWDVLAGAGIGIMSSHFFTKRYQKTNFRLIVSGFSSKFILKARYQF